MYARAAKLGHEAQNYAAEIALLAAIKAGEILKKLEKSPGGNYPHGSPASVAVESEYAQTLADMEAIQWRTTLSATRQKGLPSRQGGYSKGWRVSKGSAGAAQSLVKRVWSGVPVSVRVCAYSETPDALSGVFSGLPPCDFSNRFKICPALIAASNAISH